MSPETIAEKVSISTGYTPRVHQDELHRQLQRFNVLVMHRRFGKTVFCINEIIDKGLQCQNKNPQYAYFAPFYGQAKRVAWDYFKDFTKNIPGVIVNEAELRIDIPRPANGDRIRFMLMGADNLAAARGMYFDGVVLDEYAEMDPSFWGQIIRPALADRKGWAIFIGTPKGENHFFEIHRHAKNAEGWFTKILRASETKIIDEDELAAAKLEMDPDEYEQEFECSFSAAIKGAYYSHLISSARKENRIRSVLYDRAMPVYTCWDLGMNDKTAIWWFQVVGSEYHWLKYYENSDKTLDHYAKEIKHNDYVYEEHVLPHDAKARSLDTGNTREQTLRDLNIRPTRILERLPVQERIHAARNVIPVSYFDEIGCDAGLRCLENYKKKWDPKTQTFAKAPFHNWASNGADSFGYGCLGVRGPNKRVHRHDLPTMAESEYNPFDMEAG
jgi:hypothetical protein